MKYLVLLSLVAAVSAAPVESDKDEHVKVTENHHLGGFPAFVQHHASAVPSVSYSALPHHTAQLVSGSVGAFGVVPGAVTYGGAVEIDDEDASKVVFGNQGLAHVTAYQAQAVPSVATVHHTGAVGAVQAVAAAPSVTSYTAGQAISAGPVVSVEAPAVASYSAGHVVAAAAPAFASQAFAVNAVPAVATHAVAASPAVTTYNSGHFVASAPAVVTGAESVKVSPAVATYTASAPAVATTHAVAAAPVAVAAHAVAPATVSVASPVQYASKVEVSEPVVTVHQKAVPSAVTYESQHVVGLGTKEVDVPVQTTHVHVPVEKRVHYGVEKYVAGSTTSIHKPKLSAPAIKAPAVFAPKIHHAAPEVTVQHSEVTVEQKSPNYVHQSYDAGVVVEKAAPLLKSHDVPTPVEVPQPVAVPKPYAVPVHTPVKIKSEVNPIVNVDVHTVETENVVTPVEYTAHHHVASAPVVHTAPAVHAVQAATPVVGAVHHQVAAAVPAVYGNVHAHEVQGAVVQHAHVGGAAVGHTHESGAVVGHGHLLAGGQVATHAHVLGNIPHTHGASFSEVKFEEGSPAVGVATYSGEGAGFVAGQGVSGHFVGGPVLTGHAVTGQVLTGQAVAGESTGHLFTGQAVAGNTIVGQEYTGQKAITFGSATPVVQAGEVRGVQFFQGQPWKFENVGGQVTHEFFKGPSFTFSQGTLENHHEAPAAAVPESH